MRNKVVRRVTAHLEPGFSETATCGDVLRAACEFADSLHSPFGDVVCRLCEVSRQPCHARGEVFRLHLRPKFDRPECTSRISHVNLRCRPSRLLLLKRE